MRLRHPVARRGRGLRGVVVAEPGRWEELDGYTDTPNEATAEFGEQALADCVAAAAAAFEHLADIGG